MQAMSPPESVVRVNYIRVDYECNIFQATNPGLARVSCDGDVKDIVLQVREDDSALKALRMNQIKVYKLKTSVQPLPDRPSGAIKRTTRRSAEEDGKDEEIKKALEDLKTDKRNISA